MAERELDWSQASVTADGTLIVPLRGDADNAWVTAYRGAEKEVALAFAGEPARYRPELISGAILVKHVREGFEAAVRSHVDALIQRANENAPRIRKLAALRDAEAGRVEEERVASAARMTERFRRKDQ
jgi:hypothetical protein